MPNIELISPVSIRDISTGDIINIFDKQDRETAFQTLALLYCRAPEASNFLRNTYGFTPEVFTEILSRNMRCLFEFLPKEYTIDFLIDTGDILESHPLKDKKCIMMFCNIVSQGVLKRSYEVYQDEKTENPALDNYDVFYHEKENAYMTWGMGMRKAGFFGLELFRENIGVNVFDNLLSTGTELKLASNVTSDTKNIKKYLPVPLRQKDGSLLRISDRIRAVQEGIIGAISRPPDHIGLVITTNPTADGRIMLDRQGYGTPQPLFQQLGSLKRPFIESVAYKMGKDSEWRYKLIHLPNVKPK